MQRHLIKRKAKNLKKIGQGGGHTEVLGGNTRKEEMLIKLQSQKKKNPKK